jgi:hypothetical protein
LTEADIGAMMDGSEKGAGEDAGIADRLKRAADAFETEYGDVVGVREARAGRDFKIHVNGGGRVSTVCISAPQPVGRETARFLYFLCSRAVSRDIPHDMRTRTANTKALVGKMLGL